MAEALIYKKINAVMNDIGAVGKTSRNEQQKFMFRGIDAVMNAINPALTKHNVFVVPTILEQTREERTNKNGTTLIYSVCTIKYTFYAEDGSFVEAVVIGEGMDTGDKATNKAMSIALKYALFQVFMIPTEEMVDPDSESHEIKGSAQAQKAVADYKTSKISEEQMEVLKALLDGYGILSDFVCGLYKVNSLNDLTGNQYENIQKNIEKIKARQEAK